MDHLLLDGKSVSVEVLESLVRTYLVAPRSAVVLAKGQHVSLVIAHNPPVPCTVMGNEENGVRLFRGWRAA